MTMFQEGKRCERETSGLEGESSAAVHRTALEGRGKSAEVRRNYWQVADALREASGTAYTSAWSNKNGKEVCVVVITRAGEGGCSSSSSSSRKAIHIPCDQPARRTTHRDRRCMRPILAPRRSFLRSWGAGREQRQHEGRDERQAESEGVVAGGAGAEDGGGRRKNYRRLKKSRTPRR
ncbi:hypothetical protein BS50DRAFT_156956 [Corynespora cassiicola Philippines]|uniref:Uncharacterized protein n=1 Tax=Corynespora cassiicola Philippines TaxID=1448308 RepID=A0A2T2N747_CORCC|nr:hypothetical protein BS50DRAFT_156956 [Corynespora cassiicola Philippines]